MTGAEDGPLLVLDRVGEGRVALLASDHAWLWNRGFEGGGPQLELLRRLAHWMMKEPELEEEALRAEATGQKMRIIRRTLDEVGPDVTITTPSGEIVEPSWNRWRRAGSRRFTRAPRSGSTGWKRRAERGDRARPRRAGRVRGNHRQRRAAATGDRRDRRRCQGAGMTGCRASATFDAGRPAAGRGWIGITPRGAYETLSVTQAAAAAWLVLLLVAGLIIGGWLREGRR